MSFVCSTIIVVRQIGQCLISGRSYPIASPTTRLRHPRVKLCERRWGLAYILAVPWWCFAVQASRHHDRPTARREMHGIIGPFLSCLMVRAVNGVKPQRVGQITRHSVARPRKMVMPPRVASRRWDRSRCQGNRPDPTDCVPCGGAEAALGATTMWVSALPERFNLLRLYLFTS